MTPTLFSSSPDNRFLVVKLQGGLGNQLFQYAFAMRLKEQSGLPVFFDLRQFVKPDPTITPRKFHLQVLIDKNEELPAFLFNRFFPTILHPHFFLQAAGKFYAKTVGRIFPLLQDDAAFNQYCLVRERKYSFDPEIFVIPGKNNYYEGYWQSYKYFPADMQFVKRLKQWPLTAGRKSQVEEIPPSGAVAVHIRRTDYLNNQNRGIYEELPLSYYARAIEFFRSRYPGIPVFLFTDDPEWVQENLRIEEPFKLPEPDENDPLNDLLLMSRCRYQVISNSTFSWWAAWLNEDPGRIIVRPEVWFKDRSISLQDLFPPEWIVLS